MLTDPFPPSLPHQCRGACSPEFGSRTLPSWSTSAAPTRHHDPSFELAVTSSSSPALPLFEPTPDGHFGQVRRPCRRPYSSPARSAARPSRRCRQAASRAEPDHLSPRIIPQIPVNPCNFCKRAPEFYLNQPAVLISSKIISFRSFSLCSSP